MVWGSICKDVGLRPAGHLDVGLLWRSAYASTLLAAPAYSTTPTCRTHAQAQAQAQAGHSASPLFACNKLGPLPTLVTPGDCNWESRPRPKFTSLTAGQHYACWRARAESA